MDPIIPLAGRICYHLVNGAFVIVVQMMPRIGNNAANFYDNESHSQFTNRAGEKGREAMVFSIRCYVVFNFPENARAHK